VPRWKSRGGGGGENKTHALAKVRPKEKRNPARVSKKARAVKHAGGNDKSD